MCDYSQSQGATTSKSPDELLLMRCDRIYVQLLNELEQIVLQIDELSIRFAADAAGRANDLRSK